MYDAVMVGARCAGSPTALPLARKGRKVLVGGPGNISRRQAVFQLLRSSGGGSAKPCAPRRRVLIRSLPTQRSTKGRIARWHFRSEVLFENNRMVGGSGTAEKLTAIQFQFRNSLRRKSCQDYGQGSEQAVT